jgi:hypothetical protein
MTSYCLVEDGAVTFGPTALPASWRNISGLPLLPPEDLLALGWLHFEQDEIPDGKVATASSDEVAADKVVRHWTLEDAPPPPPEPVPETISDRQFAQALATTGVITRDEARAWVKVGDVPAALAAVVDAIGDDDVKFATQMLLEGATQFERHHPQTLALAAAMQWADPQLDALWTMAAAL